MAKRDIGGNIPAISGLLQTDWTQGPNTLDKTGLLQIQVMFCPSQPLKRNPLEVQLFCGNWCDEQVIKIAQRERK